MTKRIYSDTMRRQKDHGPSVVHQTGGLVTGFCSTAMWYFSVGPFPQPNGIETILSRIRRVLVTHDQTS